MKNSKMLLVLATSIVSAVSANITNNSVSSPIADICVIKMSVNDTSDDGNILHKFIKHAEDEDFEFDVNIRFRPGALAKDIKAGIQQFPYNQFPQMLALQMYTQDKYINLDLETQEVVLTNLKALLSGKDSDDKTPLDLLKENPDLVNVATDVESFMQETGAEFEENKKAVMEQRMQKVQAQKAMITLMLLKK